MVITKEGIFGNYKHANYPVIIEDKGQIATNLMHFFDV